MPKGTDQVRGTYQPQHQFIADSNQSIMQASVPVRGVYNMAANGQIQPMRGGYPNQGQRVQYQNSYAHIQMQPQEVLHQGNYLQYNPVYNNHNQFQYQQQMYPSQPQQQSTYRQPMYVIPNQGGNQNFVVQQPQHHQNAPQTVQQPRQMFIPQHSQQMQQHHQSPQPNQPQQDTHTPKKRIAIKLTDPNTGKDLTNDILKKKEKAPVTPKPAPPVKISVPVVQASTSDEKLKANANFAAQVAALQNSPKAEASNTTKIEENLPSNDTTKDISLIETSPQPESAPNDHKVTNLTNTSPVEPVSQKETLVSHDEPSLEKANVEKHKELDSTDGEKVEVKSEPIVETPDVEKQTMVNAELKKDEVTVAQLEETNIPADNKLVDNIKTVSTNESQVGKKKNKKQRLKDIDAKQDPNDDLLSAFKDAPKKETPKPKEEPIPAPPKEDPTWEDKEKTIDKEVIQNDDAEEPDTVQKMQQPRVVQTTIVSSEEVDDDEKLQYDRDFLLKFQFNPICTSKPANLPNIDIVLDTAHQPTKPLVPGQRISSSNDFMPTFMRQASGGRSSGGNRSKDRRGPSSSMGGNRPQKVIQMPQFVKVELKKSDNAWVRPSEQAKDLPEDLKEMHELERNVRAILNKLTPQKFKTLVDQMSGLKINTVEKLEKAIEIIFEKAISEPGFSVAYANMCRVLTETFKAMPGDKTQNFRKLLLNKCQKEFEKEKLDDQQMEEDRSKTFDTDKEMKMWKEELDYREMQNRRRTLGNIRFIGELFKLKMISEKIMHECILKLLRNTKPESMEDHLECLCKLLSTIGKDLDHQEAKPRMDQYFQQIQKIIEKKKISSRIKFALRDVIDLRRSGWVPRRDEGNPKTIDQIHREAQRKEKEEEMARQQDKLKRSEPRNRGGGGGRDSPSVRPNTSSDGWTSVPSKVTRPFASTPVDVSKFKIKKNESGDISLGPGGRPGAWSRGASGGSSSRSGSGSNTPTSEIDQKGNRYDLLAGSSDTPALADNKRGSRPNSAMRKGSQGTPGTSRRATDERSDALRAVRNATAQSGRNQSPVRSGDSTLNSPSSGSQTPVDAASPTPSSVDEDKMRKIAKSTVEEFFGVKDYKEAILCIKELEAPQLHWAFVSEVVVVATEKKSDNRLDVGKLVTRMAKDGLLTLPQLIEGFTSLVELAPDLAVDIPLFYKYLGEVLGPVVAESTVLSLAELNKILQPLVQFNKAGLVMAEALNAAAQHITDESTMNKIWVESGLTWDKLLAKGMEIEEFVKDKKVEYTLKKAAEPSHASKIQEELLSLLKAKSDQKKVIEFIDENVSQTDRTSQDFIRSLTYAVCQSVVVEDEKKTCVCQKELLKSRTSVLLRYIDGNKTLELQAAFALQNLVTDMNQPRGLLTTFFEELYEMDIISEETIDIWATSKEFPDGKGVALSEVKGFLQWLKDAQEEQNDQEAVPTNLLN